MRSWNKEHEVERIFFVKKFGEKIWSKNLRTKPWRVEKLKNIKKLNFLSKTVCKKTTILKKNINTTFFKKAKLNLKFYMKKI